MSLKEYIDGLTTVKREVLLGRETADALHGAFAAKRVVHAGLLGDPVLKETQQAVWTKAMAEDLGIYRLTKAGEFWYINLTQSLLECLQAAHAAQAVTTPAEEGETTADSLDAIKRALLERRSLARFFVGKK